MPPKISWLDTDPKQIDFSSVHQDILYFFSPKIAFKHDFVAKYYDYCKFINHYFLELIDVSY